MCVNCGDRAAGGGRWQGGDTFLVYHSGRNQLRRGSTRPGVRRFISDLDKPAFAAIQGKGTKASKFPIESVSEQLVREQ